jgi:transposase
MRPMDSYLRTHFALSADHRRRCTWSPRYEIIVLRELQGMAYKEIADVVGVPIGTVMSRLARARKSLQHALMAAGIRES